MERMWRSEIEKPDAFIESLAQGTDIVPEVYRKLKQASAVLNDAKEIEHFQNIGMICRETLIELSNSVYSPEMANGEEQPKKSDFKNKIRLFIASALTGPDNADYRSYYKKVSEIAWDYANKITHSTSSTIYEASICVTLGISIVTIIENIRMKISDPFINIECENCKSRQLSIINQKTEDDVTTELNLECEECGNIITLKL